MKASATENRTHVTIKPKNLNYFEVPNKQIYYFSDNGDFGSEIDDLKSNKLRVYSDDNDFNFYIRYGDVLNQNNIIFDTRVTPKTSETAFYYSDRFIQFSTKREPDEIIYGLGQRQSNFLLPNGIYTIFPFDQNIMTDNGDLSHGGNIYGHHPFYIKFSKKTQTAIGVYMHTSSPLDFLIRDTYITTRAVNGIIDLYFFSGPTIQDVIKQYHQLIGYAKMMPFWAFGWHLGKDRFNDPGQIQHVLNQHHENNIPLDGIWHGAEYTKNNTQFTVDDKVFSNSETFSLFSKTITEKYGVHYIPMIDEGIADTTYQPKTEGERMDVFLKMANSEQLVKVQTAYGTSLIVDYFHVNASVYWENIFERLRKQISFSGKLHF